MVQKGLAGEVALDPATIRDLATISNRAENTHSGVKDQLTNALAPLKNPIVRFATNTNTFDLRKLRNKPMSVYLTIARPDLASLRPIINLFFQHLVDRVQSRKISASQLELLAKWLDGEPEVPIGQWYKRFSGMIVCGGRRVDQDISCSPLMCPRASASPV